MKQRFTLLIATVGLLLSQHAQSATAARRGPMTPADATTPREIFICVSDKASEAVRDVARELADRPGQYPLLKALSATHGVSKVVLQSSESILRDPTTAAYNHLIVIGLPGNDPLVDKVWDHYAAIDTTAKTLYAEGWGYLAGDLGYIESDRNPFLHSHNIESAPFETELVKISGTSEQGLRAAANAFERGLINGIVPAGDFKRPQTRSSISIPSSLQRRSSCRPHFSLVGRRCQEMNTAHMQTSVAPKPCTSGDTNIYRPMHSTKA